MAKQLPPLPFGIADFNSALWQNWFKQVRDNVNNPSNITWGSIDFTNSNLTNIATRQHADLQNVLGGQYHVSPSGSAFANSYTTGTWSPIASGITATPSGTITYTASFTKIGNIVHFVITIAPPSGSTLSGTSATVSLPTVASNYGSGNIIDSTHQIIGSISPSTSVINIPNFSGYSATNITGFYFSS